MKPGLNIGPGRHWEHPQFINLDTARSNYPKRSKIKIDVEHDLILCKPFPFENETFEMIYCSHVIEHLSYKQAQVLIKESKRVLKPGGVFRISCPCFELGYNAYKNNDKSFFEVKWDERFEGLSIEQQFMTVFAAPMSKFSILTLPEIKGELIPYQIGDETIRRWFDNTTFAGAFQKAMYAIAPKHDELNKLHTSLHITAWTEVYLEEFAFLGCRAKHSCADDMRGEMFDNTVPHASLYMEYVK